LNGFGVEEGVNMEDDEGGSTAKAVDSSGGATV
jgi:hypothetical protein